MNIRVFLEQCPIKPGEFIVLAERVIVSTLSAPRLISHQQHRRPGSQQGQGQEVLYLPVAQPFAVENLKPRPDLVVVGNAISRGNVELEEVLDNRIPFCSLPQILHDEFLVGKEVLVVAGTHGKTTTSSLLPDSNNARYSAGVG